MAEVAPNRVATPTLVRPVAVECIGAQLAEVTPDRVATPALVRPAAEQERKTPTLVRLVAEQERKRAGPPCGLGASNRAKMRQIHACVGVESG